MKKLIIITLSIALFQGLSAQEGKYAEVNGIKLYYEVHGAGEPLLLLHGNTMNHDMWNPWVEDLSKNHKVITVDMRGHGKSKSPKERFSHKAAATDFYGLLNELKVNKFKAMGFSSGAMTLIHMATMDTTRIQSLVLIGGTPYFPVSSREHMRGLTFEHVTEENPDWMAYMKEIHPGGENQIRTVLSNYVQGADSYDDMNFTKPYLSTINCPTLIIHGDRDPFFTADIPITLFNAIPNSYLWIIPNFKHSTPQNDTALGSLFIETVDQFFAGDWE